MSIRLITSPHSGGVLRMQRRVVSAAPPAPRDCILNRLREDHAAALACVTMLRREMSHARQDRLLTGMLLDKLSDAPDDIHHIIERMLFHDLRRRLGPPLIRRFDLDKLHEERRERRSELLKARDNACETFANSARERRAVLALCDCAETHATLEERLLLPFAERFLSDDDWAAVAEALDAYSEILAAITSRRASFA